MLRRLLAPGRRTPAQADDRSRLETFARLTGSVWWEQDAGGRYTRVDAAGTGALARLPERLLGRTRWEGSHVLLGEGIAAAALGAGATDWQAHRRTVASREAFAELVWMLPAGNGMLALCESGLPRYSATGEFLGYAGVLREVGDELARERRAHALRHGLRSVAVPLLTLEATGPRPSSRGTAHGARLHAANAAACALLGTTEADLLRSDLDTVLIDADAPPAGPSTASSSGRTAAGCVADEVACALAEGRSLRRGVRIVDRQGATHAVNLRLEPIAALGPLPAVGALALDPFPHDAEARRAALEAAERALAERDTKLAELEAAARELELFSSAVSHDLRAPLRVVDGFARILREDFSSGLGRFGLDHVERIVSATARMNRMIDALLRLARVSSEAIEPEPVDLSALAAAVVDELRRHEPQREVEVRIAPSMRAEGDRTLLRIVLENLIGNAWKYSSRVAHPRIDVEAQPGPGGPVFCVRDNGAGFDMRFADRLFRVFQRLHSASEFPGTGVGLATVSRIVRRHRGRIWAEGVPGQGARFYFTLNETGTPGAARP